MLTLRERQGLRIDVIDTAHFRADLSGDLHVAPAHAPNADYRDLLFSHLDFGRNRMTGAITPTLDVACRVLL